MPLPLIDSLRALFLDRLFQTSLVDFCGFVVGGFGGGTFGFADLVFLGVPADFDGLFAPVDALLAGSDRLAADFDPDRVRVTLGRMRTATQLDCLIGMSKLSG